MARTAWTQRTPLARPQPTKTALHCPTPCKPQVEPGGVASLDEPARLDCAHGTRMSPRSRATQLQCAAWRSRAQDHPFAGQDDDPVQNERERDSLAQELRASGAFSRARRPNTERSDSTKRYCRGQRLEAPQAGTEPELRDGHQQPPSEDDDQGPPARTDEDHPGEDNPVEFALREAHDEAQEPRWHPEPTEERESTARGFGPGFDHGSLAWDVFEYYHDDRRYPGPPVPAGTRAAAEAHTDAPDQIARADTHACRGEATTTAAPRSAIATARPTALLQHLDYEPAHVRPPTSAESFSPKDEVHATASDEEYFNTLYDPVRELYTLRDGTKHTLFGFDLRKQAMVARARRKGEQ